MNLRTVFHLFRSDVLRLRWLLLATLACLLVELWPWIFNGPWSLPSRWRSYDSDVPADLRGGGAYFVHAFPFAAWLLAAAAGWCGIREGRVRPVRRRETVLAKALFLIVFLWLPQILSLFLVLHINGIPGHLVPFSIMAAAGVFIPMWTLALLSGRLAGSFWRWTVVAGAAVAAVALAGLVQRGIVEGVAEIMSDAWGGNAGPHAWYSLVSLAGCLLLLLAVSRSWKLGPRAVTCALLFTGCFFFWRAHDWFRFDDTLWNDPALASAALEAVQAVPSPGGIKAKPVFEGEDQRWELEVSFATEHPPPGVFCFWQSSGEVLLRQGADVIARIPEARPRAGGRPRINWLYPPAGTPMDNASLAAALPPDTRLTTRTPPWNPFEKTPARIGSVQTRDGVDLSRTGPVSLEADLTGVLYRHDLAVDAGLEEAREFHYNNMRIHVRKVTVPRHGLPCVDIAVTTPASGVASDPLHLNWRMNPFQAWRIFLLLPATGELIEWRDDVLSRSGPLLGGAAMHRRILEFDEFTMPRQYSPADLAGVRVLILAPRILGFVQRRVSTPPVALQIDSTGTGSNDFYDTFTRSIQPRHFFDYALPRRPDPATASDDQLGEWLRLMFGSHTLDDWQAAELARWVPGRLDLLLRIPRYTTNFETPWGVAIVRALPEDRRREIIRRVPDDPTLVRVLVARGWVEESRAELLQLFRSGRYLDDTGLTAIVSLRDPSTYDELLSRLEQTGSVELYHSMRLLHDIEPRLTESVRRWFARITIHGKAPKGLPNQNDESRFGQFVMPVEHGLPEAVADLLAIYWWLDHDGAGRLYLGERLTYWIELPPNVKRGSKEAREFFHSLQAAQCRWDPVTRRWLTQPKTP